jgi:hypothetical protein
MSENNTPSTSRKLKSANSGGRPKKPIWRFFEQGDEIDKGHYVATCLACNKTFRPGKTTSPEFIIFRELAIEAKFSKLTFAHLHNCRSISTMQYREKF